MRSLNSMIRTLLIVISVSNAVNLFAQLTLQFSGVNPTCHGYTNGIATVTVSGGSGSYGYLWENGQAGASNYGLPAGFYKVTVTDLISGTTATGTAQLTHPPQVNLAINPVNANCGGFNGNLTTTVTGGVGGYQYAWSNGATTASLTNLNTMSGGYFLTVTDANGCSDIDFVHIYPQPNMFASYQVTNPKCGGEASGAITDVHIYGNYGPFQYSWPGGVQNTNLTSLVAGTYTLTLTDNNGCTQTIPISLTAPTALNLTMSKKDQTCSDIPDGEVRVNVSGGTEPYTYLWNNGRTTPVNGPVPAGKYDVTVTDKLQCADNNSITVNKTSSLSIKVVSVSGACGTASNGAITVEATGGVAPYSYIWSYNFAFGPTLGAVPAGTYTVTATDASGCSSEATFTVPTGGSGDLVASMKVTSALCAGQNNGTATAVVFGGSAPYSYAWNVQSINAAAINGLAGGTNLIVTVTDANGCRDTAVGYVSTHQAIVIGITPNNVNCINDTNGSATAVATNGASPYKYLWNIPGQGLVPGQTVFNLGVGAYVVTVTDNNGCTAQSVANIVSTDPLNAAFNLTVNGCAPNITTTLTDASTAATSWNWTVVSPNGVTNYTSQNPGNLGLPNGTSGTIQLSVVSANGCTDAVSQPFTINSKALDVALASNAVSDCEQTLLTNSVVNNDPTNPITVTWYSVPNTLNIQSPSNSTTTFTGAAGNYTLYAIVNGTNGCSDTLAASVTLSPGQPLNASAFSSNLCDGLKVDFNYSGTLPGVWNFGDGTTSQLNDPSHLYSQAGTYTVTFTPTNAPCVAPYVTTIQVSATPAVQAGFQHEIVTCDSVAVFRFINTTVPATGLTYSWNLGQGITSTLPNPIATYNNIGPVTAILTATAANGCQDTANVTFPFHIVYDQIAPSQSFCAGATPIALNPGTVNPNYAFKWEASPADPNLNTTAANPVVNPTVQTTYTVTISWGGCQIQRTCTITPNAAAQLTPPADVNSCENGSITLTASSTNGTIRWSTNPNFTNAVTGTTFTLTPPITNGTIYVQATTPEGCSTTDPIQVSVQPVNIVLQPSGPQNFCAGDDAQLSVINQDVNDLLTFGWSNNLPGSATQTVSPTVPTTYTVTVTNQFGCTTTASFSLTPVSLSVSIQNLDKDTLCPGETTRLQAVPGASGNYTYLWTGGADQQIATVSINQNETYSVTITDDNGCTATADADLAFRDLRCARPYIFLPSAFTPNDDTNNDRIMVRGANIQRLYFVIYDRWGEEVYQTTNITDQGWDGNYKGKQLSPDAYGYFFRAECIGGEVYEEKGNLTLLR